MGFKRYISVSYETRDGLPGGFHGYQDDLKPLYLFLDRVSENEMRSVTIQISDEDEALLGLQAPQDKEYGDDWGL